MQPLAADESAGASDGDVREWISQQLARTGHHVVGEMGEPRVRPWSVVIRVPTDDGDVWFKANRGQTTYEPALLNVLAREVPDLVLAPVGTDVERGWSLLPDGGPMLRSFPDDAVLRHWERLLPAYAELQQALSARTNELIGVGVPDDRPARMPGLLAALLDKTEVLLVDEPDGLSTEELTRLRELRLVFAARCDILADSGIAPRRQVCSVRLGGTERGPGSGRSARCRRPTAVPTAKRFRGGYKNC
jgi:hypothetical protein